MKKEKKEFKAIIMCYVIALICITSWVSFGAVLALTSFNIDINGDISSVADESAYTTLAFTYDDSTKTATVNQKYSNPPTGTLVIPFSVLHNGEEYSVKYTGIYAFQNCSELTSITIPASITIINFGSFAGCSKLTSVTIPSSVTFIGSNAFDDCSALTSVTIPSSVTTIGTEAFKNCSSLTSITIPANVTIIEDSTFYGCSSLTSVSIPKTVKKIDDTAFHSCSSLTSIIIPSSVTSIGWAAFAGCSKLTSVTIPSSLTSIGKAAFQTCSSLTSITIPASVTYIGDSAFSFCSSLTSVTFKNTTGWKADDTSLSSSDLANKSTAATFLTSTYYAHDWTRVADESEYTTLSFTFNNSAKTASVSKNSSNEPTGDLVIPSSVLHNGEEYTIVSIIDFMDCQLTSVSIPATVKEINDSAFAGCSSLTSITIPASIKSIYFEAFAGCSKLTSVTFVNTTGWKVSDVMTGEETALNSSDLTDKSKAATFLTSTYKSFTWTRVADESDYTTLSFTFNDSAKTAIVNQNTSNPPTGTLVIPSLVLHNGEEYSIVSIVDFMDCQLTSVTIPKTVEKIDDAAFAGCSGLTSITIPESVTYIGDAAFSDCSSLSSITIPSSVTVIYSHTFDGCSALTSINIPEGITSIGDSAFAGCSKLTSVTFENTTGWKSNNTTLSSSDLADTSKAAKFLTSTYCGCTWTRS